MRSPTARPAVARTVLGGCLVVLLALGTAGCGNGSAPAPTANRAAPPATPTSEPAGTEATIPSPEQAPRLDPAQRDAAFTQALASKNLQVGDEQTRTTVAESVCQALDSGVTVSALAEQLQEALGGPTPENTGFIIGAATAIYCPENLPKLKDS
ncbi:DUF732 domain-containing protein [Actinomycetospora soli]|uniref:DUF732 domain-containing protein n=1 Tax=Actinomycetospora soli TaxID=2893887 RepID=UPI001E60F036|nr:DUF732 domain-containing protein [Actinomycetospora soli]MCD2191318.1 DUF732 domain-containing protein [Actinomycetospora soli]